MLFPHHSSWILLFRVFFFFSTLKIGVNSWFSTWIPEHKSQERRKLSTELLAIIINVLAWANIAVIVLLHTCAPRRVYVRIHYVAKLWKNVWSTLKNMESLMMGKNILELSLVHMSYITKSFLDLSMGSMYDFHDSTDNLKFWTEKRAINKTFLFFICFWWLLATL